MKTSRSITILTLALTGTVLTGFGDDLFPPPWDRLDPAATMQAWSFSTAADPAAPDIWNNPFGTPSADITVSSMGSGWWDSEPLVYGSKYGWWDIGEGEIELYIPNSPYVDPGSYKLIQVQVTYWLDINQAPIISVSPYAEQQGATETAEIEKGPVGGAWYLDRSIWRLSPNPENETIFLTGPTGTGSMIDQIVVDTICIVPEPSSVGCAVVLGLGALWYVRRRRA